MLVGLLLVAVLPVPFGWQAVVIESASMQPAMDPGDVLVAAPVDQAVPHEGLQNGQVLLVDDPARPGELISHRLVGTTPDGRLLLRGDANAVADSTPIEPERLRGVGRLLVPWVGLPRWWAGHGEFGALAVWLAITAAAMAFVALDTLGRSDRRGQAAARTTALLLVACVAAGSVQGARAAWSASTRNPGDSLGTGTVALADSDGGSTLFSLSGLKGNDSSTRCVRVTSTGSRATQIRLYGTTAGTGLDPYVSLTITRGSYTPTEPAAGSCTNFAADSSTYLAGQPAGVIYTGTLQGFGDNYASGLLDPTPTAPEDWTIGEFHVYKIELTVGDNNTAAGRTATQTFTWEARSTNGFKAEVLSDPKLVGYWRLGETSGTTAADLKSGYHGTYSGGVTLGQTGALTSDTDKAASFDGVDDTVTVPHNTDLNLTKVSIEAWIKADAVSGSRFVLGKGGGPYYLYILDGTAVFGINGSNGYEFARTAAGTIIANTWYHLLGTDDGSSVKIYINGALTATLTRTGTITNTTQILQIGSFGTGGWFDGIIDEVAVYNDALTMEHAQNRYRLGISG